MKSDNRISGIDVIGSIPWGAHFCQFYQTKEDLIETLVPYFKAGLENSEFCMWVTSPPLETQEAKEALRQSVPDLDIYLEKKQIEIIPYTQWYLKEGVFNSNRVLKGWIEKLNQALTDGYDGLRLTGNTFWLEKKDWNDFFAYEEEIDRVLGNYKMISLCTYSLDRCNATEIIDVVANHQYALIKREGKWEQIESSKRKRAEEALKTSEERLSLMSRAGHIGLFEWNFDRDLIYFSPEAYEFFGCDPDPSFTFEKCLVRVHPEDRERIRRNTTRMLEIEDHKTLDRTHMGKFRIVNQDGTIRWLEIVATRTLENGGTIIRGVVRDITEQKQAEEALKRAYDTLEEKVKERTEELEKAYNSLKESEMRLAEAQRMSHIGNYSHNLVTNELYWSDELYRIFGFDPEETIIYEKALRFIHPDDRAYVSDSNNEALSGNIYSINYRIIRPDGEERIVHSEREVIFDERNNPVLRKGIVQDITERKCAEEEKQTLLDEVQAERDKLSTLINNIPDEIWFADLNKKFTLANSSALREFGLVPQDVDIGKFVANLEIFYPDGSPRPINEAPPLRALKGEVLRNFEEIVRSPFSSNFRYRQINASPVRDRSENIIGSVSVVRDITEQKKALEKIQNLANIVKSSNDAIVTESLDSIITFWNKGAEQIYGYSAYEVLGKPISILEPSMLFGEVKKLSEMVKRGETIQQYETLRLRKDGEIIHVSLTLSPVFDIHGKLNAISVIARDITERKKAEEALSHFETARKQEIHHRIKNNLQVISSLLDLQAEQFKNRKDIKDTEVLKAFKESQDRVISMALIHEELYKDSGFDTLNFSAYIKELAQNLVQTYKVENININLNLDLEEDTFFDMDLAVPLGIIINELISNSLKHAFTGRNCGKILIRLHSDKNNNYTKSSKTDKSQEPDTTFVLTISDDGTGIPEELNIFEIDTLGMQLVTSLINQLDGEVDLQRVNGTGFTIRFIATERNYQT